MLLTNGSRYTSNIYVYIDYRHLNPIWRVEQIKSRDSYVYYILSKDVTKSVMTTWLMCNNYDIKNIKHIKYTSTYEYYFT